MTDFRVQLRQELESRCRKIPRYSLRAFARDLELSPSRLSEVLSGKQGLSAEAARAIARRLGYSEEETQLFCDQVESQHARARVKRDLARIRLEKKATDAAYHVLQADTLQAVSEWYHFAILQLICLRDFRNDAGWIARALDISQAEASGAVERLKRLGLIEERAGKLHVLQEYVSSPDGVPSAAVRKMHRHVLERALQALETQPVEERDFSAMLMPIDRARLPEAKRWIRNFRRRFCRKLDSPGKSTDVYCFSAQFFNLTHSLRGEKT